MDVPASGSFDRVSPTQVLAGLHPTARSVIMPSHGAADSPSACQEGLLLPARKDKAQCLLLRITPP